MYNSFEIGLVMTAMNSGGPKPKPFHPWPLRATRQTSNSSATTSTNSKNAEPVTANGAAAEPGQEAVRYSTDSESILKDAPQHTSTKTKKSNLLKKLTGRATK